jgi:PKD repeat protein
MRLLSFVIIQLLQIFGSYSFAQWNYSKLWDARFGGTDADLLTSFRECLDGGFLLGGYSQSLSGGDKTQTLWGGLGDDDFWIVKTDASGNKEWDKDFGGYFTDRMYSIQPCNDGGYLLCGESISGIGGDKTQPLQGNTDYWIIKIDSAGNKLWDKDFGGTDYDYLNSSIPTSDGGFLLAGVSSSPAGGDKTQNSWGGWDYWIIKIDSLGNKIWDRDYGGTDHDYLNGLMQTGDGGFILGGHSISDAGGDKSQNRWGLYDFWIVKIDSIGNLLWEKDFGGTDNDYFNSIALKPNGNALLAGISASGVSGNKTQPSYGGLDFWMLEIDSLGNLLNEKAYGGNDDEDFFGSINKFTNGDYLLAGISYSNISGVKTEDNLGIEQSWLVRIDSAGNLIWDKTIFTPGHDEEGYAIQTSDGCIAVANYSNGNIGGYKSENNRDTVAPYVTPDYWLVKFCDSTVALQPVAGFNSLTEVCPGTCIDFTNTSVNAISYLWYFPGATPGSSADIHPLNICYYTPGTYDVMLIASGLAGQDTLLLTNYMTVYPNPQAQGIIQSSDTLFANAGSFSYQWYLNGSMIAGATNYFYVASVSGDYNVIATDSNGCEVEAAAFDIIAGQEFLNYQTQILIRPNPVFNTLEIYTDGSAPIISQVNIYNAIGEKMLSFEGLSPLAKSIYISVETLSPGLFYLEACNGSSYFRTRFVKY